MALIVVPRLILMRGLPGSGKSYLAKQLAERFHVTVVSADDYFTNSKGEYNWDANKVHLAHKQCQERCSNILATGRGVIVDNTNIKEKEINTYLKLSKNVNNAKVTLIESNTSWGWDVDECAQRNTHGVPVHTIQSMKDKFWKPSQEWIDTYHVDIYATHGHY